MSQKAPCTLFLLVDSSGNPFKEASIDSVSLPPNSRILEFRIAVKSEYDHPSYLRDIPTSTLKVYKNKAAFMEGAEPLDPLEPVNDFGKTYPLFVVVPDLAGKVLFFSFLFFANNILHF